MKLVSLLSLCLYTSLLHAADGMEIVSTSKTGVYKRFQDGISATGFADTHGTRWAFKDEVNCHCTWTREAEKLDELLYFDSERAVVMSWVNIDKHITVHAMKDGEVTLDFPVNIDSTRVRYSTVGKIQGRDVLVVGVLYSRYVDDGGIYIFDLGNGRQLQRYRYTSPDFNDMALVGDTVIVATDEGVEGFNFDGTTWKALPVSVSQRPYALTNLAEHGVAVSFMGRSPIANDVLLNPRTGEQLAALDMSVVKYAMDEDRIYAINRNATRDVPHVVAYSRQSLARLWTWSADYAAQLAVVGSHLLVAASGDSGNIFALDLGTGAQHATISVHEQFPKLEGPVRELIPFNDSTFVAIAEQRHIGSIEEAADILQSVIKVQ